MAEIKAFAVQESDEGTGGIYFAKHAIVALRRAASEFGDGTISGWSAKRAQWADSYAPGPVPELVMIEHGWWFECPGCGVRIDSDGEDFDCDPVRLLEPVEVSGQVYCCAQCREQYVADRAAAKACEEAAIASLTAELLRRLPGVTVTDKPHAYATKRDGVFVASQAIVNFTFPGCTIGPATFRFDKIGEEPHALICAGDMPAWEVWRSKTPTPKGAV